MNTRKIETKKVWFNDGEKDATILALTNFYNYRFDGGGGTVEYKLIGMESPGQTVIDDVVYTLPESAVEYYTGTVLIPSDVVNQWGQSDGIIWDYVASKLSITYLEPIV